jgi:hypothetical protein
MKHIDVRSIIKNFYKNILEDETRSDWEAYSLLLFPSAVAQVAIFRPIDGQFISNMMTSLAILFGFTYTSLLTAAKNSPKDDRVEKLVVQETRMTTSYALLMNLITLIAVVVISIAVVDYTQLGYVTVTALSAGVYFLLFHYLMMMLYLMRYLYLLSTGGAFESDNESSAQSGKRKQSDNTPVEAK